MLRAPIDPLYPQLEHGTRLPLPPSLLLSLQPVGVLKLRRKNQSAGLPVPRKMGDGGGKGWLRHAASTAKSIALGFKTKDCSIQLSGSADKSPLMSPAHRLPLR